jgi:hypothetical protein
MNAPARAALTSIGLLLGVAVLPVAADAASITITFEGGVYDPNPPVTGPHGPYDLLEDGARYAGFWLTDPGTPEGAEIGGHTHVLWDDRAWSLVDMPHSWRDGMQGGRVSLLDGSPFRVVSIDYHVTRRLPWDGPDPASQFALLPWSTGWENVQLMLSADPDPSTPDFATFEAQWSAFAIDDGSQFERADGTFDPWRTAADSPWRTLMVTGFDAVTELYIGHTGADVEIDTIVIERVTTIPVPEPGTALLLSLGLGLLSADRRRSIALGRSTSLGRSFHGGR